MAAEPPDGICEGALGPSWIVLSVLMRRNVERIVEEAVQDSAMSVKGTPHVREAFVKEVSAVIWGADTL